MYISHGATGRLAQHGLLLQNLNDGTAPYPVLFIITLYFYFSFCSSKCFKCPVGMEDENMQVQDIA